MTYVSSGVNVRGRGSAAKIKKVDLVVDFSTNSTDFVLLEHLWSPFDYDNGYTRNGYIIASASVSVRCGTSGVGRFGISVGTSFTGWFGLAGATETKAQSSGARIVSSPIVVYGGSSGTVAVALHIGRLAVPGPSTLSIPVLSDGTDTAAWLISEFVVDETIVPP